MRITLAGNLSLQKSLQRSQHVPQEFKTAATRNADTPALNSSEFPNKTPMFQARNIPLHTIFPNLLLTHTNTVSTILPGLL